MTHTNGTYSGAAAPVFEVEDLHVSVEGREILRGLDLVVSRGEVHALMGRNGSGKSTLANALMGHPKYQVTRGNVRLAGENILTLRPDERAARQPEHRAVGKSLRFTHRLPFGDRFVARLARRKHR